MELPIESKSNIYTSYSATTFTNPLRAIGNVKKIIIKFCLVSPDLEPYKTSTMIGKGRGIEVVPPSTFLNESIMQQQISMKTANDDKTGRFQKATPYIVFNKIFDSIDYSNPIINLISRSHTNDEIQAEWEQFNEYLSIGMSGDGIKHRFSSVSNFEIPYYIKLQLGVIAMTMAPSDENNIVKGPGIINYGIAHNISIEQKNKIESNYTIPVVYELLRVAVLCKRVHKDLHGGNYFVEYIPETLDIGRRVQKYDNTIIGVKWPYWQLKATLIDWGRSLPLPDWIDYNSLKKDWF